MLTFLFWNIHRKPLSDAIATIAEHESVDVVILAESTIDPSVLLKTLNREEVAYHFVPLRSRRIMMLTRFPGHYLDTVLDSPRLTIHRMVLPAREEFLLASIHFPSKRHWNSDSQNMECAVVSDAISEAERRVGHARTILVGDLNMNPFEPGVVGARGLHAVMSRRIAQRGTRTVQGKGYTFFYNPMWGHLGDWLERPVGSYYYESSQHLNYFWNTFDQVLVRPDLMSKFRSDQLKILDIAGEIPLANRSGQPDQINASDHFPLLFRLDL